MSELIFLIEDSEDGGFTAQALGQSIFTEGDNMDELKINIKEAVKCHFDANNIPHIIRLHMVKDEVMAI